MKNIEPVIILLAACVFISIGCLFYAEHHFHDDGQLFQVIAGLATGFSGSLFTRLKTSKSESDGSVNIGNTSTINEVPNGPPKEN